MRAPGVSVSREFGLTLGLVSGGHFLSHLYVLAYPPLFPLLIEEFGLNNTQLGLVMSVLSLAMFLLQTPVGELTDRIGAKRVFVLGVLWTAAATALVGVAGSYLALLAFVVLAGIGQSAFHPADYTLLDAVTEGDREGRSFGIHTFAGYVGFAAAPPLVGGLGVLYGWRAALLAVGAFGLVYALLAQLFMPAVHRRRMADRDRPDADPGEGSGITDALSVLARPGIVAMFAFFVVITMATKGIQTFTTVYAVTDLSLSEVVGNTALTLYFSLTAIGVLVGGVLADRYDSHRVIVVVLTLTALLTWAGTDPAVAVTSTAVFATFAAIGFCYGLALPARDRLVNAFSTAETTGKSFGFVYTGLPLGGFLSPTLLGAVIDATGIARNAFVLVGLFYIGSAAIVAGIVLYRFEGRPTALLKRLWRPDR